MALNAVEQPQPPVNYLVTLAVLSVQMNASASPRLVMIPANSVVELKSTSSVAGLVELIWEQRTHMIFEADLVRLNVSRTGDLDAAAASRQRFEARDHVE